MKAHKKNNNNNLAIRVDFQKNLLTEVTFSKEFDQERVMGVSFV